ncbi:MAG: PAS domain S-box protein [Gammaproteobacteria bacterium]|nr:PAS domain S-box protein [Gammaproteobacteria bacterium]
MSATGPDAEARRLATLASYGVLDTPNEKDLDDLVRMAAQICETPIALISLADDRRHWFKAAHGLSLSELPRDLGFCNETIRQGGVFVVEDAVADPRFAARPLCIDGAAMRFYAGAPLLAPDGSALGTLCVFDLRARNLAAAQAQALLVLSRHVMAQFELRRQAQERNRVNRALLSLLEDERLAETAVRESAELNRAVLDAMLAHIAVIDKEGRIIAVNGAWRRFAQEQLGRRPELLARTEVGANYLEACARNAAAGDAYAPILQGRLAALLRGELRSFSLEYPLSLRGGRRWFLLSATPLRTAAGGAAVSHFDITERKEAEEQLRLSNERFETLARATNDAIRDWDLIGDAIWWNEGYRTQFGSSAAEQRAGSDGWRSRIHPDDRARVLEGLHRAIEEGAQAWSDRYRFARSDGSYAEVTDRGQLIRDEEGRVVRMLAGMTDVTERVELEEQLRQSHRLEAVGQLTGGVAHDFNNLLTVIMGNAELIRERVDGEDALRESAGMIVDAARSAAELTKRLLAFARKQALNPAPVEANGMIRDMAPLLRRTLGEDIQVELRLSEDPWLALVDGGQLENALLNLCINSRDAMPGGGVLTIATANVRLEADDAAKMVDLAAGDYVSLEVRDAGAGIAPDLLGRVFEPFFTTKDKIGGTGLGLAMVYGFVKQSGGHITIESELGLGTAVRMVLPRAVAPAAETTATTGTFHVMHGAETILVVEDNEQVRRFAVSNLQSLGYTVLEAANGRDALAMLERQPSVDLLFTDVVMPGGMGGRQLVDAARALRADLKVLFTSGYAADSMVHEGRLDEGVQLLMKPYRRSDLARRIRSVLDAD